MSNTVSMSENNKNDVLNIFNVIIYIMTRRFNVIHVYIMLLALIMHTWMTNETENAGDKT